MFARCLEIGVNINTFKEFHNLQCVNIWDFPVRLETEAAERKFES